MEVAYEGSSSYPSIWTCSRRNFRRQSIAHHIGQNRQIDCHVTCATGLYGHALSTSKRRLIDRCRHNDPSLMCLKWDNNPNNISNRSGIRTCSLCDGLELSMLAHSLLMNRNVRTLDISGFRLSPRAVHSMAELIEENSTIVHMILDQTALGDKGIEMISKALSRNGTLKILSIRRVEISWIGMASLASALAKNFSLTTLDIRDNYIYQRGARVLAQGLRSNTASKLTSLDMQSTSINTKGIESVMNVICGNSCYQFQHLNLSNNFAGAAGITIVANSLIFNRTLTTLNLSGNICGDEGAIQLANALRVNQTLVHLNLSLNDIRDRGACSLAAALRWNLGLKHVDLSMNKISSIGLRAISLALIANNLVSIDAGSNISDTIVQGCFTFEICRRLKQNRSRVTLALELGILLNCTGSETWKSAKQHAAEMPSHSCASCFECRGASIDDVNDCKMILDRIWSFVRK